jgi:hypothetical protein
MIRGLPLVQVLKCHHSVHMRVKTWNLYVEEEHFMHLVRLLSSSILFVRLVAIAVREFSVPYISEDILHMPLIIHMYQCI